MKRPSKAARDWFDQVLADEETHFRENKAHLSMIDAGNHCVHLAREIREAINHQPRKKK